MRIRILPAILLSVLLVAPAAAQTARDAEEFLAEVEQHLRESSIFRENYDAADVRAAAIRGLRESLDRRAVGDLSADDRELLKETLDEFSGSRAEALRALEVGAREAGARLDLMAAADFAAVRMIRAVGDHYGRILHSAEFQKLMRMLRGEGNPDSLGLGVNPSLDGLRVENVLYDYAAYRAGIRTGDLISHLGGDAVGDLDADTLSGRLSLEGRDEVVVTLRRAGYDAAHEVSIRRVEQLPPDVESAMLGAGIGYVRLTMFNRGAGRDVQRALAALREAGMRACILDLRNNPGGDLMAAGQVADQFLSEGRTVARCVFNYRPLGGLQIPGLTPPERIESTARGEAEEVPLLVLTNHSSASASELVAGALQQAGRARTVGENTYGKGVGQSIVMLRSTGMRRLLYLTVMRYYVGGDTEVGEEGVAADVRAADHVPGEDEFVQMLRLRGGVADRFAGSLLERNRELAEELAEYDDFDPARYPSLEEWARRNRVDPELARAEVRYAIRARLAAERNRRWTYDLVEDDVLQQAILLLGEDSRAPEPQDRADRLREVVAHLASPDFRGRGAGTPDGLRAAEWVAGEMVRIGLAPAGEDGTFFQGITGGGRNVLGRLDGPEGTTEYVVVGAHHDGQGVEGGRVLPSADDNASGVAVMLDLAERMAAERSRLRRNVIFASFDGEELGLVGSRQYMRARLIPRESVVLMLCYDLVGGSFFPSERERVYLMGLEHSADLARAVAEVGSPEGLIPEPVPTSFIEPVGPLAARSDYAPFRAAGVPYLFFSTATPWYYHTPDDTIDRLDFAKMARISELSWRVLEATATTDRRYAFSREPEVKAEHLRRFGRLVDAVLEREEVTGEIRAGLEEVRATLEAVPATGLAGREALAEARKGMMLLFRAAREVRE